MNRFWFASLLVLSACKGDTPAPARQAPAPQAEARPTAANVAPAPARPAEPESKPEPVPGNPENPAAALMGGMFADRDALESRLSHIGVRQSTDIAGWVGPAQMKPNGLDMSGWSIDRTHPEQSVRVVILHDGRLVTSGDTFGTSEDVAKELGLSPSQVKATRFSLMVPLTCDQLRDPKRLMALGVSASGAFNYLNIPNPISCQ